MNTDSDGVWCRDCGTKLFGTADEMPAERTACPQCGSFKRHVAVSLNVTIGVSTGMRVVGRAPGQKKPFVEARAEPSTSVTLGRNVHHERTIDRRNDKYTERVTDPTTGEVLHECDEPLSKHRGHGSAKSKT